MARTRFVLPLACLSFALFVAPVPAQVQRQSAPTRVPTRINFYCSAAGKLYPVAPAGDGYRALAGPLGDCRNTKELFIVALEGTMTASVPRDRNDAVVTDVDRAVNSMTPQQARDNGGLEPVQTELRSVKSSPVVVTAPAKVIEKATSGLKDTLKTQV